MAIIVTTDLPDAEEPSLDPTAEDEIAVDFADVINNGDYRVQIRKSGEAWP